MDGTGGDEKQQKGISRRDFLKMGGAGAAALAAGAGVDLGVRAANKSEEVQSVLEIMTRTPSTSPEKSFQPDTISEFLPRSLSKQLFEELGLGQTYPHTLNEKSFYRIIQDVCKVANLNYQGNDPESTREEQLESFVAHCRDYLEQTLDVCGKMEMDPVACMLLWQVSGANTSSAHAFADDIRDERVRSGVGLVETLYGQSPTPAMISVLRTLGFPSYAMARVEGRLTLGIHDIEIIMIARALISLRDTQPHLYQHFEAELSQRGPSFMSQLEGYVATCDEYQSVSQQMAARVSEDEHLKDYLSKYHNPEALKKLLTTDGEVDDYQLSRTTVYWAELSKAQALTAVSGYVAKNEEIERRALSPAIKFYLEQRGPEAIFFDNCTNPKFINQLKADGRLGDERADALLQIVDEISALSDKVIREDRQIGAALIREGTEHDQTFQIITGVAYARWLLTNARSHQGLSLENLLYDDPSELAFDCFLGTAHRETGASHQLGGSELKTRATLPFEPLQDQLDEMDRFIKSVYLQTTNNPHPREDMRQFMIRFAELVESTYVPTLFGTDRHNLTKDEDVRRFIQAARDFGSDRTIITPPHCSWQRAMEATLPYVAEMA